MVSENDTSQMWCGFVGHVIAAHTTGLAGLSPKFWCQHFGLWVLCLGRPALPWQCEHPQMQAMIPLAVNVPIDMTSSSRNGHSSVPIDKKYIH